MGLRARRRARLGALPLLAGAANRMLWRTVGRLEFSLLASLHARARTHARTHACRHTRSLARTHARMPDAKQTRTRCRGVLAEGEERLYRLRQEREGEARKALNEERARLEKESRETMVGAGVGGGRGSTLHPAAGTKATRVPGRVLHPWPLTSCSTRPKRPPVPCPCPPTTCCAGGQAVRHALWRGCCGRHGAHCAGGCMQCRPGRMRTEARAATPDVPISAAAQSLKRR